MAAMSTKHIPEALARHLQKGRAERALLVERAAIDRALQANRYNKTAAARQLGLTLRALRYRMQKLGMD